MQTTITSSSRQLLVAATTALALLATGCANMSEGQRDTAIGAGVGAVAGGLIGDGKGAVIGAGLGALGGYGWSRYMENKRQQMQQATAGTGVQVSQTADNRLKLNVPSDVSFDTNSATIKPNLRPILDQFAQGLGQQPGTEVTVVGYTDSTGSPAINDPLSVARANSVRDYLMTHGVNAGRIATEGRGARDPVADNGTEAGRAQNRRVEIFLADRQQVAGAPPQGQYNTPVGGQPVR